MTTCYHSQGALGTPIASLARMKMDSASFLSQAIAPVNAELSKRHLYDFIKQAWPVIEPGTPFADGFHIQAICEHLEAVTEGEIKNLLINIPPRCMKSIIVSVMWPVWVWIHKPAYKWLFFSYAQPLATDHTMKSKRIIESDWFSEQQKYWKTNIQLSEKHNLKTGYANTDTGYRDSSSVGGKATGFGGDCIVADDPHNVKEAESDLVREGALTWWRETIPSRLNNLKTGHKVVIMQRVHEADLSGAILELGQYEHLCLPMEYDPERKCKTSIGFEDPRAEDNELLWPEHVAREELDDLKEALGDYAYAGQYDQSPAPRGGNLFEVNKIELVDKIPEDAVVKKSWRAWDKAGTMNGGAYTVGVLMHELQVGVTKRKQWYIEDVVRGQWRSEKREDEIAKTADQDGKKVRIAIEQEPGSGGLESAESTVANTLPGFYVRCDKPSGDKELRADTYSIQVNRGNVLMRRAQWNREFIHEHRFFPASKYKDQVDSAAMAFNWMAKYARIGFV